MTEKVKHWNKDILLAYVLIRAAYADFEISKSEEELILTFVSEEVYRNTFEEYQQDNDIQGIEKIIAAKQQLDFCKEDCDIFIDEIEQVFKSDGKYDAQEHALFFGIKKLLMV